MEWKPLEMEHAVVLLREEAARLKYRQTIRKCTKGRPSHGRTSSDEYAFGGLHFLIENVTQILKMIPPNCDVIIIILR